MGTVISRLHTPEDENGERDVMHPETSIDAVVDPISGIHLPDRLSTIENQLVPASIEHHTNGLFTPDEKQLLQTLASSEIIISEKKPDRTNGCLWIHIDSTKTENS